MYKAAYNCECRYTETIASFLEGRQNKKIQTWLEYLGRWQKEDCRNKLFGTDPGEEDGTEPWPSSPLTDKVLEIQVTAICPGNE
jgi:hypothetical protein